MRNFTVKAGVTVTVTGKNPFVVMAKGDVTLNGDILAGGGDGRQRTINDYTGSSTLGYYHYDEYRTSYTYYHDSPTAAGGPGGGTGGGRGAKRTYTNSYGYYHLPRSCVAPLDGGGWDTTGKKGGGKGGRATTTPYRYSTGYYYYYSGAGGGGTSVEAGTVGKVNRSYSTARGIPGQPGADKVTLSSMKPDELRCSP